MSQVDQNHPISRQRGGRLPGKADFIFYERPFPGEDTAFPEEAREHQVLPYGATDMTCWHLEGIRLIHTRHRYNGHYLFRKQNNDDLVNLSFNLKGACQIHHMGNTYAVQPRQHNMVYSPGTANTFSNADLETETFSIQFTPETFLRFTGTEDGMLGQFSRTIKKRLPAVLARDSLLLDPPLQKAIHDILSCPFSGQMKRVFLLSKSMEILVMQTDAFLRRSHQQEGELKARADQERILFAGEYLLSRLQDPPNLSELAKKAGLNEYKLKRGFREVFGHTVFGYLTTHRLGLSRQMLLDTRKTAAEIAFELGFASPQHFNNAFKKQFGMAPKQFLRHAG